MNLCSICVLTAFISVCGAAPETVIKDGIRYVVWKTEAEDVRVVWKDGEGRQLGNFPSVKRYLEEKGEKPLMLMNGGIFEPRQVPSGLMVQHGKELLPLNTKDGSGNFFLKPNGIFLIGEKGARVMGTGKYPPAGEKILYAVQSGPLLLEHGETHPAFNEGSKSRLLRNGVGVTKEGVVIFAISDARGGKHPNLFEFADLFRSLGCADALFLDGAISQMKFGGSLRKQSNEFASVISVVGAE